MVGSLMGLLYVCEIYLVCWIPSSIELIIYFNIFFRFLLEAIY
jgi:hypothetical protein